MWNQSGEISSCERYGLAHIAFAAERGYMKHRQAVSMEIAYLRLKHTHTYFSEGEISPKSNNFPGSHYHIMDIP